MPSLLLLLPQRRTFAFPTVAAHQVFDKTVRLETLWGLCDRPDEVRIDLRHSVEIEQAVLLLLDVGQLRVAKPLDGTRIHESVDELAINLQEFGAVRDLQPAA